YLIIDIEYSTIVYFFPYTTLFRSVVSLCDGQHIDICDAQEEESLTAQQVVERIFGILRINDYVNDEGALASKVLALWACGRNLRDRKSTRLNSSHVSISYAVFCLI